MPDRLKQQISTSHISKSTITPKTILQDSLSTLLRDLWKRLMTTQYVQCYIAHINPSLCLSYNILYHVVDFKLWMCYIRFVEKHVDTHTHGEFIYVFLENIYLTSLHARHYSV